MIDLRLRRIPGIRGERQQMEEQNMVLAVDIGNTNIVLGVFDRDELVFTARVSPIKTGRLTSTRC